MESESMNLNTIRTDSEYNFVKLFNEALAENDDIGTINGSPFENLIMVIMNANTTHQKILPKTYTPLIIHYHYFVSTVAVSVQTGIAFMN